jgi:hypothetical protein
MFETILQDAPELRRLEGHLEALQQERSQAYGRVAGLAQKVGEAREQDLAASANALNRGRERPRPRAPKLEEQHTAAADELALLDKRIELLTHERALYLQEHHQELFSLLKSAHTQAGNEVARQAGETLATLLQMYRLEDEGRQLQRSAPPPAEPEEWGDPQSLTTIWPLQTTQNFGGGPKRGEIEGVLRLLQSYAEATEVGEAPLESEAG